MITSLPDRRRRAVITGIGVVAPTGIGTEPWWSATLAGVSGIRRISRFDPARYPIRYAGEIDGFEPTEHLDRRLIVQTDRWTWLALAATRMALGDARFDPGEHDPYSCSVITASSTGGNEFAQCEIQNLWGRGPEFVGAYMSIAWFYAATSGQISIRYGLKGPSSAVAAEGAGALEALAHARRTIRRGVDTVVSGGTEAPVGNPMAVTCQLSNPALSRVDAAIAYRPFDADATGAVPGEGGAILLVESLERALERGAPRVYGEIVGYGAANDAEGALGRVMTLALNDAGIGPQDVDAIVADGAGTPAGDAHEADAIRTVFGARRVPIVVPKSTIGRAYAGGAALDVAAALLAMRDGRLPPIVNLTTPVTDELDFVTGDCRSADVGTVLVAARGHGGFNGALVLRRGF